MKAVLVDVCGKHVTVRMTPSWIARVFGARETVCEVDFNKDGWYHVATGRRLWEIKHGALIRAALNFWPAPELPRALARMRTDRKNTR